MVNLGAWPAGMTPRKWQEEARARFESRVVLGSQDDFLCVATPGGGKTLFALMVMHDLLTSGVVGRCVVVCPTAHLKEQWISAATRVGIHLDNRPNSEGWETSDFHGAAMTYAQVSRQALLHRRACLTKRTLVVLDETHHAGSAESWGTELKAAFSESWGRLLLTGTPWRDPESAIPFVRYDERGRSVSDYDYGYAKAVAQGVCRPVVFRGYDGEINWHTVRGDYQTANLKDEVAPEEAARRLRTALDPAGRWLRGVLVEADAKLREIRGGGHPDAAGLVIAKDQYHAKEIVRTMGESLGDRPELVISDEPGSSERIARFRDGTSRWIVAVKMVSEGVDVPRLRVGVYATNTIAKLFFNQVTGRFVRMVEGVDEQTAYLYLPSDDRIMSFAKSIMEEQAHELREALKEEIEREIREIERMESQPDLFLSGTSGDPRLDEVVTADKQYTANEMANAQRLKALNSPLWNHIPDETIAEIVRQSQGLVAAPVEPPAAERFEAPPRNRAAEVKELRGTVNKTVWRVAHQQFAGSTEEEKRTEVKKMNALLNFEIGAERKRWTLADCRHALEILKEWGNGSTGYQETV